MKGRRLSLDEERNLLAIARGVAGNYAKAHPTQQPHMDDLVSDACKGVAESVAHYDPDKGAALTTYAYRRAAGAIVDGVRSRTPMSRGAYAREGADAARRLNPLSLDLLADEGWAPAGECSGYSVVEERQVVDHLLKLCTPTERFVVKAVVMYGFRGVEVARHLGVTEAAVSTFKRTALERMRTGVPARHSSSGVVAA